MIEAALHSLRFRFPDIVPLTVDTHAAALAPAREHGLAFYPVFADWRVLEKPACYKSMV